MICGIYARKSTDQNGLADESKSVARQVEHARLYAARKAGASRMIMCTSTTGSRARCSVPAGQG
jgi:hypothetical protein